MLAMMTFFSNEKHRGIGVYFDLEMSLTVTFHTLSVILVKRLNTGNLGAINCY